SRLGSVMTVVLHRLSPHFLKLARASGLPGKQSAQVVLAASARSRRSTIRDESCHVDCTPERLGICPRPQTTPLAAMPSDDAAGSASEQHHPEPLGCATDPSSRPAPGARSWRPWPRDTGGPARGWGTTGRVPASAGPQ